MKFLYTILLIPYLLFGSKILNHNIYDRTDRVDIMLTFDIPFNGKISQKREPNRIKIVLSNTTIDLPKSNEIKNRIVSSIKISPASNQTEISLKTLVKTKLSVSKTVDGFGLRIRVQPSRVEASKTDHATSIQTENRLPVKQSQSLNDAYFIVIGVVAFLLIILMLIKNRKVGKREKSWLFSRAAKSGEDVSILYQKPLDRDNRVVMLQHGSERYLVIIGNSNIVLDRFKSDGRVDEERFNEILQDNKDELENYLHTEESEKYHDALSSYKEKASIS